MNSTKATTTKNSNKVYFPNLDGLRFISFLAVFFYHSFATDYDYIRTNNSYTFVKDFLTGNGNLGVYFFFVLSGFLITYLLLAERSVYGTISIRNFYIRRILRIWPLFYFCVIFGFFIFPQLKSMMGQVPNETAEIGYYLVFLNNFNFISNGLPDASTLGILWSVAIEEQFYLFWPVIMYFVPKKYYLHSFIAIIIASFCFRYMNVTDPDIMENHTLSCISDMVIGGIFAWLSFYSSSFKETIRKTPKSVWILLYLTIAVILLYRLQIFTGMFWVASDRIFIAILFGFVIMEQNYADHSFYKMSNLKVISRLGTYTYGLYCLHTIGILITAVALRSLHLNTTMYQVIFLQTALSLVISIGLGIASYHLYEKHFLKLKERFTRISSTRIEEYTTEETEDVAIVNEAREAPTTS